VRFDQGSHSPWRFRRLTVTLTVVPDPQPPLYTSEVHHPGGMWLGSTSGAMVFLVRDSQV